MHRFEVLLPHLYERQRRLTLAAEARLLGHGGVRLVAQVAGVSETTVRKGVFELEDCAALLAGGRVRRPGGGRLRAEAVDPGLIPALMELVEPDERGDPMSPLRWTIKSLWHLAAELSRQGHRVTAPTVGRLLKDNRFSPQSTAKTLEGEQHPDRDAQFRYINGQVKAHQAVGEPVISVDAKKKEQFGWCYRWPGGSGARAGTRSRWRTTASSPARACRRCHSAIYFRPRTRVQARQRSRLAARHGVPIADALAARDPYEQPNPARNPSA